MPAGAECEAGETAPMWVHAPALMKGCPGRHADAVVRQGCCKTGEIGRLDDRGRLLLKDRGVVEQYPPTRDVCPFPYKEDLYGEDVGLAVVSMTAGGAEPPRKARQKMRDRQHLRKKMVDFLSTVAKPGFQVDRINDDVSLVDAGAVDSLAIVQIILHIEQNYALDLPSLGIDPGDLVTINGIVATIARADE